MSQKRLRGPDRGTTDNGGLHTGCPKIVSGRKQRVSEAGSAAASLAASGVTRREAVQFLGFGAMVAGS